jgi:hypothetical protein
LRIQPAEVDRFARILAIAISAIVEPGRGPIDLMQQSMGALPIDDVEVPVHRSACLIGLIALAEAVIRANLRDRVQFMPGVRTQLQQLAAEVFHLQRVSEFFGI